ncbi:hypothetical protein EV182_007161, partial [Spiromyces aspiralis]
DLTLYREIPASKVERVHKVQGPGRSRPDLAVVQMRSSRRVSARLVAKEKASVAANTVDSGQPVLELDPALLALEREENGDIWEPVCLTINEWEIFPDQLAGSPNTYQRRLHGKLINTIQPDVLRELKVSSNSSIDINNNDPASKHGLEDRLTPGTIGRSTDRKSKGSGVSRRQWSTASGRRVY